MPSYAWIKLYIEVLDDPKMGRLSPQLWQRAVQMFLFAGREGNDGSLPPVADMAWTLRVGEDELLADLHELALLDITAELDGEWGVVHFAERQAPTNSSERTRQFREREFKRKYYGEETQLQRTCNDSFVDTDTDTDTDTEKNRIEIDAEISLPFGNEASSPPPPAVPSAKKTKPAKPKKPIPAAVQVYRGNTGRNPPAIFYQELEDFIGSDTKKLEFWAKVIKAYVGCGWNPGNVANMLDFFRRGELPTTGPPDRGGNGHGKNRNAELQPESFKAAAEKWGLKT